MARTEDDVVEPVVGGIDLPLVERLLHEVVLARELRRVDCLHAEPLAFEVAQALRQRRQEGLVHADLHFDRLPCGRYGRRRASRQERGQRRRDGETADHLRRIQFHRRSFR